MAIRRLWQDDAEKIKELLRLRSRLGVSKLSDEELQGIEARIDQGLKNLNCVFWANTHSDGSLRCVLLQILDSRWPDTWNAALLITDGSTPSWNYRLNGLDDLWRVAFTWGHSKGCREVVWSLPAAWARTMRHTAKHTDIWLKYDVNDLEVVPAYEFPSDPFKRWVFGETAKSYPVLLRHGARKLTLSPEDSKSLLA